ncbi:unnamed protein product [Hermetia illucens]|uniref:Uncharacterized protein n=1 Tax=Hermetia illucens TaxID=343691 RepID=A0A7R8V3J0_HERIL|nr:coiled-coil domain-containing protein 151 [Hermetia illucens]CAD7091000.1 unnamed protein product [Hermetia illucens]
MAEADKAVKSNKNIADLKKNILLAEGQKKANVEEWEKLRRTNAETIATLKKDIKELREKIAILKNPTTQKYIKQPQEVARKIQYPLGMKTPEEAIDIMDLKIIEVKKKLDVLHDKYTKRQKHFNMLVEEYKELLAYKKYKNQDVGGPPPETLEEDANRKLICRLENEIHRTNVQWMEAEHIRKKYKSIKASLMNDAEKFEKSLRELEQALKDQHAEINRLQVINKEAIEMRDAARVILQKQEQQANQSTKAREKQAQEFRRQVEDRKMELERIERKLFSAGKSLVHQESIGSSSGDQQTGKTEQEDDPNAQLKSMVAEMETTFKKLMEVTGATSAQEVLQRFTSQKESTSRLNYLRSAAEAEKKHLEAQREILATELETLKFADIKESEVNQELIEKLKNEICGFKKDEVEHRLAAEQTRKDIKIITEKLIEMIFKLQEVDECDVNLPDRVIPAVNLANYLENDATDEDLLNILGEKLRRGLKSVGQLPNDEGIMEDEDSGEIKVDELYVPLASPRALSTIVDEKPQPLPKCYMNLANRGGQVSVSPGQASQAGATDDESEVPSRTFLKRQSLFIVDSKSRRKGFRPPAQRRK